MKYMTFNSSCAFAGVANLLSCFGVDVEDREIALGMKLPYLFEKEDGAYLAGPMLQSAKWFNLYLNTIGFSMAERLVAKENVITELEQKKNAMLGIHVSPKDKHAVVYVGREGDKLKFLNNKWQHIDDPEMLQLTEEALLQRMDDEVMVASIHPSEPKTVEFSQHLRRSSEVLAELKRELISFCAAERTHEETMAAMNTLFRPVLLDGITMLGLLGQEEIAGMLRSVQTEFMTAIRAGKPLVLANEMDMETLLKAMDKYAALIQKELS